MLAIEFLRTLFVAALGGIPVVLSRRPFRGLEDAAPAWCSFCWCRNKRSRLAKHLVHCGHSKGFSFVWERSCRFRCSSLANERPQVPHTCGLGLSVLGGGKVALGAGCEESALALGGDAVGWGEVSKGLGRGQTSGVSSGESLPLTSAEASPALFAASTVAGAAMVESGAGSSISGMP